MNVTIDYRVLVIRLCVLPRAGNGGLVTHQIGLLRVKSGYARARAEAQKL